MKVFIGGFGGVGSRLVSNIFEQMGHNVEKHFCNPMYDWGAIPHPAWEDMDTKQPYFLDKFDWCFKQNKGLDGDYGEVFNYIDEWTSQDDFTIKHGHLMYIFPQLKERYPDCKTVYVNRNPIDSALKYEYAPHFKYSSSKDDGIKDDLSIKVPWYLKYAKKAIDESDLVVDYENLCLNPHEEIEKMKKLVGSKHKFQDYSFIKTPKTFGVGKKLYKDYDLESVKSKIYTNADLTFRELENNDEDLSFLLEVRNDDSTKSQLENDSTFKLSECKQWYSNLKTKWKMIQVGGVNVGYLRLNEYGDVGCDIHPHHRRRGYAKVAYKQYLKYLRSQQIKTATLWVFEDNFAKNLYESLGFKETGNYTIIRNRRYVKMECYT